MLFRKQKIILTFLLLTCDVYFSEPSWSGSTNKQNHITTKDDLFFKKTTTVNSPIKKSLSKQFKLIPHNLPHNKKIVVYKEGEIETYPSNEPINQTNDIRKLIKTIYLPYIQIGGSHFFGKLNFNATKIDLFAPIWQNPNKLIFIDP